MTETVLWTNPSPTSSFPNQQVTLSGNISDYKYLKFVFNLSNTSTASMSCIYDVEEFKTLTNVTNSWSRATSPMRSNSNNNQFVRPMLYINDTKVDFGHGAGYNANNTQDATVIPYQIIGIN